ncbi:MAG: 2Fe-2S iron-sulfur cluster binding domain-containing protein, partial [Planctomycetes bacterium]|nr:2Fe-2S iron-sulfur cluster binding domain-containing protein [Planctomycetota bacterium]
MVSSTGFKEAGELDMHQVATTQQQAQALSFTLNGQPVSTLCEPGETLLDVLRERLGIISPKNGCQPQASCGCCTVTIGGRPLLSCVLPAAKAAGKEIVTNEGLPEEIRRQISDCFVRAGAVQCGFCIPGIINRSVALVAKNPSPTRDEIAHDLRGHLCRCTGYVKILDAVEHYAALRAGQSLPPADPSSGVGARLDRYTGQSTALGDRAYVDDLQVEGMLFAAPRLSDHPRATLRGIDATEAEKLDGMVRVLTAADVPGERHVGLIEKDWPIF